MAARGLLRWVGGSRESPTLLTEVQVLRQRLAHDNSRPVSETEHMEKTALKCTPPCARACRSGRLCLRGGGAKRPTQREAPRARSRAVSVRTSAKGAHARSVGGRASASTSASGADARSAGGRASASTSAKGANARIAARRLTRRCRPAWRSCRGQRMLLVKTCDLSHGPHVTVAKQS